MTDIKRNLIYLHTVQMITDLHQSDLHRGRPDLTEGLDALLHDLIPDLNLEVFSESPEIILDSAKLGSLALLDKLREHHPKSYEVAVAKNDYFDQYFRDVLDDLSTDVIRHVLELGYTPQQETANILLSRLLREANTDLLDLIADRRRRHDQTWPWVYGDLLANALPEPLEPIAAAWLDMSLRSLLAEDSIDDFRLGLLVDTLTRAVSFDGEGDHRFWRLLAYLLAVGLNLQGRAHKRLPMEVVALMDRSGSAHGRLQNMGDEDALSILSGPARAWYGVTPPG